MDKELKDFEDGILNQDEIEYFHDLLTNLLSNMSKMISEIGPVKIDQVIEINRETMRLYGIIKKFKDEGEDL